MIRRLLALFVLPLQARALGTDVYWYEGNSGQNATVNPMVSQAMLTAGATTFTESVLWPSSFSSYRVVFLSITRTAYTTAQIADLSLFVDGGGVLVLIGEATPYDSTHAVTYNSLLAGLGRSSRFSTSASYDSGCVQSALAVGSHPLSTGVPSLGMAWGGAVLPAGTGSTVYQGASGQAFVAYDQGVVLVPDGEVFNTACTALPAANGTFAANIYNMACDWDADGEQAAFCGGLDCDDQDPLLGTGDPFFRDYDGDGFGDATQSQNACTVPAGYVADATDCDDLASTTAPGRSERCDGADNDCDGAIDEALPSTRWYLDADADGYGGSVT
ncbi:MAG TPA: putative metal-binding motif-containing protein, partial [Myxococcota bacterium]|nr:putative metal-binding motif-containing protein [Myxococcota bacterium]